METNISAILQFPGESTSAFGPVSPWGRETPPPHHTYLSQQVPLGPYGLHKGTQVTLGHGEQRGACVHNALAALGTHARGLVTNKEPEW
jgi:hypothetical protein